MNAVYVVYTMSGIMLLVALVFSLYRLAKGPTVLDRAVATDLLTSVAIAAVVIAIALSRRADLTTLLVIFALTGFFSSTAIARFADREATWGSRLLTPEEARRERAQQQRLEEKAIAREARAAQTALGPAGAKLDDDDGDERSLL